MFFSYLCIERKIEMSEKFPYGYDVNAYIDKAFGQLKELYPWAERSMLRKKWSYAIEKEGADYQFVSYFVWDDGERERTVLKGGCKEFIETFISHHESWIQRENPVKDTLSVVDLMKGGKMAGGWYIEAYCFRSHAKGGYSVYLQGGDRSAGGSRTIFIPPAYFKLPWDEFLDAYVNLVPPGFFGLGKSDLENASALKAFLGY